ncbi:hypothetical protein AO963_37210 [Pseudomonas aeruginosa]|uniref:DUF4365 domain-containing protein n=1 Tax=Pseudomonas aeruginosa TaxID=287 RepID=UPI0008FAEC09|nr:DUF4365 domain-containing protein [Pseudomonas aeruginosa]KSH14859.2 hypothetical protein AO963_37210 [Pseudomonas aeruginosa]
MRLPKVGSSYAQERLGINALQNYAAKNTQIWRETATGDVGIDGNLEFVNPDGFATGKVIAVQVKSGPSYFKHESINGWKFYPEEKHRAYWEAFPLPVILVLHDSEANQSYWADVRQALRTPAKTEKSFIEVPQCNLLQDTAPTQLFSTAGVQVEPFIFDLDEVLNALLNTCSRDAGFPLSYFDLFTHGLTNICRSIYYGMDMVCNAVEFNLASKRSEFGMGVGYQEHHFLFNYVKFLLAQGLAQIDISDCLIDWEDREMQPHFVAPLTARGRALVRLIHQKEAELVTAGKMPEADRLHVAQEGFFGMQFESYYRRFPRIEQFQTVIATTR